MKMEFAVFHFSCLRECRIQAVLISHNVILLEQKTGIRLHYLIT